MYMCKGPAKLVAKSRRGIVGTYEKFDTIREINKKNGDFDTENVGSVPKPVFQVTKKSSHHYKIQQQQQLQQLQQSIEENISPQHEELIKYIHESWNMVVAENPYDAPASPDSTTSSTSSLSSNSSLNSTSSSIYYSDEATPTPTDFQPFDLEQWWSHRIYNSITKSL